MPRTEPGSPLLSEIDDERLDRLYRSRLEQFVTVRNELAGELAAAGDRDRAAAIRGLAKPVVIAALSNRLYYEEPELFRELFAAGAEVATLLREAASADQQRAAAERRRRAIQDLVTAARALEEKEGRSLGVGSVNRLSRTLEALAVFGSGRDGAAASGSPRSDRPVAGRLDRELEAPGFDVVLELAAALPRPSESRRQPKTGQAGAGSQPGTGGREKIAGKRANRGEKAAHSASDRAGRRRQEAAELVDNLDRRHREALARARDALSARQSAERAAATAERAVDRAVKKLEELRAKASSKSRASHHAVREHRKCELSALTLEKELAAARRALERLDPS